MGLETNISLISKIKSVKWDIALGIFFIHVVALFAPFYFNWQAFRLFLILQAVTALGVTLCFHRLLTHRSFMVPRWLEYILTICGTLSLQGGPMKWVSTHRVHHAFSDRPNDPHSPNKGFWWAHMMWLFPWDEQIDNPTKYLRFVPDLNRDPVHRFIEKTTTLWSIILGSVLYLWGGLPFVMWGMFARLVIVYHGTWLVNSASHLWGYQSYDTNEGSRNNWWVALISYGEGWHNNHHAYPHSAAHGLRWWEVDFTYLLIRFLGMCKLATRIRLPQGGPARLPSIKPVIVPAIRLPFPSLSV